MLCALTPSPHSCRAARRLPFSGEFLTSHLQSLMAKRGVSLSPAQAEELKERCCRASVALPHAHEAGASGGAAHAPVADTSYTLPDGQTVTVRRWCRCRCLQAQPLQLHYKLKLNCLL